MLYFLVIWDQVNVLSNCILKLYFFLQSPDFLCCSVGCKICIGMLVHDVPLDIKPEIIVRVIQKAIKIIEHIQLFIRLYNSRNNFNCQIKNVDIIYLLFTTGLHRSNHLDLCLSFERVKEIPGPSKKLR